MKKSAFLGLFIAGVFFATAQPDPASSRSKQKVFTISVETVDKKNIKGRLYAVNDSQVVLFKSLNNQYIIPAENIRSFTLKRKNSVLRGGLIGFGTGLLAGIVIGLVSGNDRVMQASADDPWGIGAGIHNMFALTAGEKAVIGGLSLGTGGAIIGTIIGALSKKNFIIGGRKEKLRDLQAEIMMKLVQR